MDEAARAKHTKGLLKSCYAKNMRLSTDTGLTFHTSQHSKKKKKKAVRTRLFIYLLTYVSSMTVETFRRNEMK